MHSQPYSSENLKSNRTLLIGSTTRRRSLALYEKEHSKSRVRTHPHSLSWGLNKFFVVNKPYTSLITNRRSPSNGKFAEARVTQSVMG